MAPLCYTNILFEYSQSGRTKYKTNVSANINQLEIMGKQTKNPAKMQKKIEAANNDTLSKQYNKFDKINYDSSDSENNLPSGRQSSATAAAIGGKIPVIDPDNNVDYMVQNQIQSFMTNGSGGYVGMGKPMTQTEYDEMRKQESLSGNSKPHHVISARDQ